MERQSRFFVSFIAAAAVRRYHRAYNIHKREQRTLTCSGSGFLRRPPGYDEHDYYHGVGKEGTKTTTLKGTGTHSWNAQHTLAKNKLEHGLFLCLFISRWQSLCVM